MELQGPGEGEQEKPWLEDWDDEEDESDFAQHLRKQIQAAAGNA